jgi:hypothetical protein
MDPATRCPRIHTLDKNLECALHRDQLPQVRRQLRNFHRLKKTLEAICEFNQLSLRSDDQSRAARRQSRD